MREPSSKLNPQKWCNITVPRVPCDLFVYKFNSILAKSVHWVPNQTLVVQCVIWCGVKDKLFLWQQIMFNGDSGP